MTANFASKDHLLANEPMKIWIATHRAIVACDQRFFALVRGALLGVDPLADFRTRYRTIAALGTLPWSDQPVRFCPQQFEMEIFRAWDQLHARPLNGLLLSQRGSRHLPDQPLHFETTERAWQVTVSSDNQQTLGELFREPIGELVGIAAAAIGRASMRAATHRPLVAGTAMHQMWRVIRGGRASAPAEALGVVGIG